MGGFLRQYLHHQDDMLPVCYDFVRMNGPEWKNQLKSLDFVSDFARLASSFPEAWTLLLDNVFPQIPSQPLEDKHEATTLVFFCMKAWARKVGMEDAKEEISEILPCCRNLASYTTSTKLIPFIRNAPEA